MIVLSCKDYFNPTNEDNYVELFSLGETNSDSRLNSRGDTTVIVFYLNDLLNKVLTEKDTDRLKNRSDNMFVAPYLSVVLNKILTKKDTDRLKSRGNEFIMEEFIEFNFLNDVYMKNIGSRFKRLFLKINRVLYPKTVLQNYGRLQKKI